MQIIDIQEKDYKNPKKKKKKKNNRALNKQ